MAWNFRRRKKIAPGVYINMSKKGISTTVGPKGASMTFGPNGTYLNTSIPGTGMYNRRKIGGNTINSSISKQNINKLENNISSKKGCLVGTQILFCFLLILYIPFISDIMDLLYYYIDSNLYVLSIALSPIIITAIIWIILKCKEYKAKDELYLAKMDLQKQQEEETERLAKEQQEEAERKAKQPNYFDIKITEEQFDEVSKVCKSLDDFQRHILIYHSDFYEFLKSKGLTSTTSDEIFNAIKFMIYSDVYVSMEVMQSSMSIRDKEGFARFMLVSTINSSEELKYSLLERVTEEIISNAESIGLGAKNVFGKNNNLTLPGFLKEYNEDLYLQYLICLYRFLSITAKADDVVKPAEADYLNNLMALLQQADCNVNVQKDYIINLDTEFDLYKSYDYSFDTISVGQYIVKCQKCIISDIQAELSMSRERVLKALKVLENRKVIITEGRTRKVLIKKESNLLRALRHEHLLQSNMESSKRIEVAEQERGDNDDFSIENIDISRIDNPDPILQDVIKFVISEQVGSTAAIQRKFEIGYNRAGKISDQLEELGVLGPNKGQEGREVLIDTNGKLKENNTRKENVKKTKTTSKSSTSELDTLVGLASVKEEIKTLSNFIKIQQKRKEQGLKSSSVSYHCVFTGNPGTGKTTVARIVAQIYKDLGILSKGHLVETDRAGLVAEYVGQTAVKTNKIIDSALDGVLFIDEAYSLIGTGQDYGKEAIATLLKRMEDNRDRLVVILAGYSKEMQDFINTNPGLQSRFNRYIDFPDYSAEELLQIFEKNVEKFDYKLQKDALVAMSEYFQHAVENKDANFGNARFVRNIFEKTLEKQANRLSTDPELDTEELTLITLADLPIV